MTTRLTHRQLATVLAALRNFQQDLSENEDGPICEHFTDKLTPLNVGEIDELCERLNLDTSSPKPSVRSKEKSRGRRA